MGAGAGKLQFWFEFASTYSYPAALRIEELASQRGVEVEWKAFLLGPIFARSGWRDSPFNLYPAKGRYMWRDLERVCAGHGLPFRTPTVFPRASVLAARIACAFSRSDWLPGFVRSIYRANFVEDLDIADRDVVFGRLGQVVSDPASVIAKAVSEQGKARLRARVDEAVALGIFGAPTFVVGRELFWGNDRLEAALDWAMSGAMPTTTRST